MLTSVDFDEDENIRSRSISDTTGTTPGSESKPRDPWDTYFPIGTVIVFDGPSE